MPETSICDIIRTHPELTYDQAWIQACQAGVPLGDFDKAWTSVYGAGKVGEHDRRVQEIIDEIRKLGEGTKTRDEWKAYFKEKGYLDDECDLGYVLNFSDVDYEALRPKTSIILLSILTIASAAGVAWFAYQAYRSGVEPSLGRYGGRWESDFLLYALGVPVFFASCLIGYVAYLGRQFKGIAWKVIDIDFGAKGVPMSMWKYDEWIRQGAGFLRIGEAGLGALFNLSYDNRETYFGVYETYFLYEYGGRRGAPKKLKKIKTPYFMVAQKTRQAYPRVHCQNRSLGRYSAGKGISLEGVDFNRNYSVSADRPQDAFYVLNPRVMSALLDPFVLLTLITFETAGDWIFMVFNPLPTDTGMHLSGPAVRYGDYQRVKSLLLHHLDLATNVNDVLSREIVDDGSKRSEAKNL